MEKVRAKKPVGLIVAVAILGALLIAVSVMYIIAQSQLSQAALSLENVYQKSFYNLVDDVNNTENKLSKVLASNSSSYSAKMLEEVSKNINSAQENLNNLPYSINGLHETLAFINQASGYCETLSKKLREGGALTSAEKETLNKVYDAILTIKSSLNKMSKSMWDGYSILDSSIRLDGDYNGLTNDIGKMQGDIEYPTMIYDGPFSDSQINREIKGLTGQKLSQEDAMKVIFDVYGNATPEMTRFVGEGGGKIATYTYEVSFGDNKKLYAQTTVVGGHLLNISCSCDEAAKNISLEKAEKIAVGFAETAGVNNMSVVWSDVVGGNAYINLAPVLDSVIYYPDLVKVKVDMAQGDVVGYEATPYYTNHVSRNVGKATISKAEAEKKINSSFKIESTKLALIPLEYSREVLTYELKCKNAGETYYFYINAQTGEEENILKVLKTDNGNLLM